MDARRLCAAVAALVAGLVPGLALIGGPASASAIVGAGPANLIELDVAGPTVAAVAGYPDGGYGAVQPVVDLTTDGGATWTERTISVPNKADGGGTEYAFGGLDFTSATNGWAGGATPTNTAILHTTNGGASWTTTTIPTTSGAPRTVAEPTAGTLLVGPVQRSTDGAWVMARTTNGGSSWATYQFPDDGYAYDVAFASATVGVALVAASDSSSSYTRVYRTADGGASWTLKRSVAGGSLASHIAVRSDGQGIAYPTANGSYSVSTDGGTTWNSYQASWDDGGFHAAKEIFSVAFSGNDLLLTGQENTCAPGEDPYQEWLDGADGRLLKATSADYGQPAPVALAEGLGDYVFDVAASSAFAVAAGPFRGTVVAQTSANGGSTWTRRLPTSIPHQPGPPYGFTGVKAWSASDVTVSAGAGLMRSTDGGATWTFRYGPDGGPRIETMPDALHGYAECEVTTDGGSTWTKGPFRSSGPMVSTLKGMRANGSIPERTTDGGATWVKDFSTFGAVFALDTTRAWKTVAGADSSTYTTARSTNFGDSWSPSGALPIANADGQFESPYAIRFATTTNGWVVASDSPFGGVHGKQHLFKTTDGGSTWTPVKLPSGVHSIGNLDTFGTTGVTFWENNAYDAGQSPHLAISTDGGSTWTTRRLPAAWQSATSGGGQLSRLDMFDATTGYAVGTRSGGGSVVIKTTDGGATWSVVAGSMDTSLKVDRPGWPVVEGATGIKGKVRVTWDGSAFTGGGTIDAYRVGSFTPGGACASAYQDNGAACGMTVAPGGGAARSIDVPATPMVDALWQIQAHTATGGWSYLSYGVIAHALNPSVPGAPTGVTATAGNSQAAVSWTAPADDGGGTIQGYTITPYKAGVAQPTVDAAGTGTTKVVTGLTNGSSYTFKVTARNEMGNGPASAASAAVTPTGGAGAPAAPTGVFGIAGSARATIYWNTPPDPGGSPITGYVITGFDMSTSTAISPVQSLGTETSKTVLGLTNGHTYTFSVAAKNALGTSADAGPTGEITPNAAAATTPGAPTGLTATAGNAQVSLAWTAPENDGGSAITGYEITGYHEATPITPVQTAGTGTTKVLTGLTNGHNYIFFVAAKNALGTGEQSQASNQVMPSNSATVPGAPTNVAATAGNALATVTWIAPASNGGSAITGYVITPYKAGVAQPTVVSSGTGTSKAVTGLTNGSSYTFKVAATNAVGTGAQSAASSAVTPTAPAPTVPGAPTGVAATAGNAQATVTWIAPASNGGSAITGYVITPYKAGVAQPTVVSSGTGTSKAVTGLTNGSSYTFKVAATNAVGTGSQSAASAAVTPTDTPAPTPAPFANWSEFVKRQYVDLTNVQPASSSLSSWVSQLSSGAKQKGDLIEALRRGTDNTTNVDPTARLYRAFLGRAPDYSGLRFWINRRRTGTWSLTRMADYFASSNEFKTKYGTLTNRQFVTRIYTDVLGRTADQAGVDYWTGRLDSGAKTRGQVMIGFSESSEYKRKQAENTDVAVAYIYLMGRAASSAETTDWVTRQKAGTTQAALATELLNSASYATHVTG